MAQFINTIDVIGDDGLARAILSKTLPEEFNDDVITSVTRGSLSGHKNLKRINVPSLTKFVGRSVMNNPALEIVIAPKATSIGLQTFNNSSSLKAVVLGGATLCALDNVNALSATAIASGAGYIYVPSSLIEAYKVATNWSTYANQFRALEDYTVDGTTTGGLDETKI